jgi:N-acetylgalactosamine-6-sulfatase
MIALVLLAAANVSVTVAALAGQAPGSGGAAKQPRPGGDRPNVVFILADDWGWGDLGCYGNPQIKTPNLDRLARQGTLFTQFYVNGSVCSPSRAAFLTGRFPARLALHGHLADPERNAARGMPNFLDPQQARTVAQILRQAGYATGHYGKWHLGGGPGAPPPSAYGFGESRIVDGSSDWNLWKTDVRARSSERIVDETIRFIERNKDKPFYVNTWILDTHATLSPTEEQMAPYRHLTPEGVPFKSPAQIYSAAATDADRHIGRLLQKLDELGLAENTLVIFSSDNGPEDMAINNAAHSGVGSAGPFRGRKRSLYEGGIRVPFIVRWPAGTPSGKVNDTSVVSGVDFLPTVCSLAGTPRPPGLLLDGENMAHVLRGKRAARTKPLLWEWRFQVFGHVWNRCPQLVIRDGKWKLLMNPDKSRVELYDIPQDPGEMNNLADRQPDVVQTLSGRLIAWQSRLPKGPADPGAGKNAYPWPRETAGENDAKKERMEK